MRNTPHHRRNLFFIPLIQFGKTLYFLNSKGKKERPIRLSNRLSTACLVLVWTLFNLGTFFPTALGAEEPEPSASTNTSLIPLMIHLDQSLHFGTPDEQIVVVPPGADKGVGSLSLAKPEERAVIDRHRALAKDLGISGTPSFIVGTECVPGALEVNRRLRYHLERRHCTLLGVS